MNYKNFHKILSSFFLRILHLSILSSRHSLITLIKIDLSTYAAIRLACFFLIWYLQPLWFLQIWFFHLSENFGHLGSSPESICVFTTSTSIIIKIIFKGVGVNNTLRITVGQCACLVVGAQQYRTRSYAGISMSFIPVYSFVERTAGKS